jgi:SAM-dependent methyltransferase
MDTNSNFVFVSYSHKNIETVTPVLKDIQQYGYNIIFDESLQNGQDWLKRVAVWLQNPHCVGVLIILSDQYYVSDSCLKELRSIEDIRPEFFAQEKIAITVINSLNLPLKRLNEIYEAIRGNEDYEAHNGSADDPLKTACDVSKFFRNEKTIFSLWNNDVSALSWGKILSSFESWGVYRDHNSSMVGPSDRNKTIFTKRAGKEASAYSPSFKGEEKRLDSQSWGNKDFDNEIFKKIYQRLPQKRLGKVVVLDLGCANGQQTSARFATDENVKTVIGVDIDPEAIAQAKRANYGDKFHFFLADITSKSFVDLIKHLLSELEEDGIDFFYASFVIHHLDKDARKPLLTTLKSLANPGAQIFLRASDDGAKLCHPYYNDLQKILQKCDSIPEMSDRECGRKLYNYLFSTKWENIETFVKVTDTAGKDDYTKSYLFKIAFSYRLEYFHSRVNKEPANQAYRQDYQELKEDIETFQDDFYKDGFWYMVVTITAIGGLNDVQ